MPDPPADRHAELQDLDPLPRARALADRLTAALVSAETSSDYLLFMGGATVGGYEAAVAELQGGRLFACAALRVFADALRETGWNDVGGPCWCLSAQEETGEPHRPACARARALLGIVDAPTVKPHRHEFTALCWNAWDFGQYSHVHACFTEGCDRVLIGEGRMCDGEATSHRRETLGEPHHLASAARSLSSEGDEPEPVTLCQRDWCRRELVDGRCPEHGEDTGILPRAGAPTR